MKIEDAYPSRYLKSTDINGTRNFTIKSCTIESVGEDGQSKPVLWFKETAQGLVLNKTNFDNAVRSTGKPDSDDWSDKQVKLTVQKVDYRGQLVDAIRISPEFVEDNFNF